MCTHTYMYIYIYIHTYVYAYIYIYRQRERCASFCLPAGTRCFDVRPSLRTATAGTPNLPLRLSLLRFVDSKIPGNALWT